MWNESFGRSPHATLVPGTLSTIDGTDFSLYRIRLSLSSGSPVNA